MTTKSITVRGEMRARKALALGLVLVAALLAVAIILIAARPAEAAFSGENGKIVFWAARSIAVGDPVANDAEIFSMNPDGTDLEQLTVNGAQDFNPAWSPDGTQIVFESRRDGNDEIYRMGEAGSNQTRLTSNAAGDTSPAWSPGGTKIVFVRSLAGNDEIYVMNATDNNGDGNGDGLKRLTRNPGNDSAPAWSPNGKKIAFTGLRNGNYEIYAMKPAPEGRKNRPVNLTRNPTAHDEAPNWSPDGTHVVFTSQRGVGGDFEIYSMTAGGNEVNPLTENGANDLSPVWSPDDDQIAFHSDRDGNGELYTMNADGSGQTRRTTTSSPTHENNPDWQPAFL